MIKVTEMRTAFLILCAVLSFNAFAHNSPSWQGIYLGGHLGGAWSDIDWHFIQPNIFNTLGPTVLTTEFNHDDSSLAGGAQLGANYQIDHWILGIEGTWTRTNLKDSTLSPDFPETDTFSSKSDWYATLAGRLGYTYGRWLAYVSGGWAFGETELRLKSTFGGYIEAYSNFHVNGWTVGAGIDYQLMPCLLLGVNYQYIDLKDRNQSITCPNCGVGVGLGTPVMDTDMNVHSLMVRLSYFFNL